MADTKPETKSDELIESCFRVRDRVRVRRALYSRQERRPLRNYPYPKPETKSDELIESCVDRGAPLGSSLFFITLEPKVESYKNL